jgi:hypothetical protein
MLYPSENNTGITTGATLMGACLGFIVERRKVGFTAAGPWRQRVIRYLAGLAFTAVLYIGLKLAFTGLEPEPLFRFIRYGLVGFFLTLVGPWIFVRIKLARKE